MTELAGITLPDDMQWEDEFTWLPVAQQSDVALSGALILEESTLLAGRPITLRSLQSGNQYSAVADYTTVLALRALAATARDQTSPMALTLPDGRTTTVMFRHADLGFEARPLKHIVPPEPTDLYLITLRLQAVSAIVDAP